MSPSYSFLWDRLFVIRGNLLAGGTLHTFAPSSGESEWELDPLVENFDERDDRDVTTVCLYLIEESRYVTYTTCGIECEISSCYVSVSD